MALLNTWASQQNPDSLTPLDRALNNYIQQGNAPLSYLLRGDPQGLLKDLNTPKSVNMTKDMTDVALNLNPIMGLLGTTAYHGSPYLFNKFDINKVGSGEGAQAYGHGIYFAENPNVAKSYTTAGLSARAPDRATEFIIRAKEATLSDEAAKQFLQKRLSGASDDVKPYLQQALNNFDNFQGGNLYKVDIPDKYIPKMLDWDKPINEQSKEVRKALAPYIKEYGLPLNEPGRSAHSMMLDIIGKREGLDSGSSPAAFQALAPKVAQELNKAGIKGIKYLDEGSREFGQGTNNFVVFDPSEVKILEKGLLK